MFKTRYDFEKEMYLILNEILNGDFWDGCRVSCDLDTNPKLAMHELITQNFVNGVDFDTDKEFPETFTYYENLCVTYTGLVFIDEFTKRNS